MQGDGSEAHGYLPDRADRCRERGPPPRAGARELPGRSPRRDYRRGPGGGGGAGQGRRMPAVPRHRRAAVRRARRGLRLRAAVRARGARGRCPVRGGAAVCGEAAGRDGGNGRASGRPGRRGGRTDRRRSPLALPEGGRTCPAVARRAGGAPGRRDVAGQGAPRRVVAGPGPVRRTGDRAGRARPGPGPALGRRGGRGVRDGRRAAPRGARSRRRRRDHRHPAVSQRCARNAEHYMPARLEAAGRPGAGRRGAVAVGG